MRSQLLFLTLGGLGAAIVGAAPEPWSGSGRCTLRHAVDASETHVLRSLLSTQVDSPVLIRGGVKHWKATELAQRSWTGLRDVLVKNYAKEEVALRKNLIVTNFGGTQAPGVTTVTLRDYFKTIESDSRPLLFDVKNNLGQRLMADELFDLKVGVKGQQVHLNNLREAPLISFGGPGDGLAFHTHGENIIGLAAGRKEWLFLAPDDMTDDVLIRSYNMSTYFGNSSDEAVISKRLAEGMYYCEQGPGDVVYVPRNWWHATRNTGIALGMGGQVYSIDFDAVKTLKNPSLLDQETLARYKLARGTAAEKAEGLKGLERVVDVFPSRFLTRVALVKYLANEGQMSAAIDHLRRVLSHLEVVEMKGVVSSFELASLHVFFGDLSLSHCNDPTTSLAFSREALRLDKTFAPAWHQRAYALNKRDGVKSRKKVLKLLRTALLLDPEYGPALRAFQELGGKLDEL